MREILIASQNQNAAVRVRSVLQSERLPVRKICRTGAQVLSFATLCTQAVVICGKLPDYTPAELADLLPVGFSVVWLLSSSAVQPSDSANLTVFFQPVDRVEFLHTVRMLAAGQAQTHTRHSKRSAELDALLDRAKAVLQAKGLSEQAAYTYLRRRSMETGTPLQTVAAAVAAEGNEK